MSTASFNSYPPEGPDDDAAAAQENYDATWASIEQTAELDIFAAFLPTEAPNTETTADIAEASEEAPKFNSDSIPDMDQAEQSLSNTTEMQPEESKSDDSFAGSTEDGKDDASARRERDARLDAIMKMVEESWLDRSIALQVLRKLTDRGGDVKDILDELESSMTHCIEHPGSAHKYLIDLYNVTGRSVLDQMEATAEAPKSSQSAGVDADFTSVTASGITSSEQNAPVRTEAGLIDPETGELLEESLIMRKFGWSELPTLPHDPTSAQVRDFESKLDQVLDLALSYEERTARWRAAAELRCKPLDGAAKFYDEAFIKPMSRMLAPHRLPVFKSGKRKGEFSKKTMALKSGAIRFTSAGGHYVHDKDLVVKHIVQNGGVVAFKNIGAESKIGYDHKKLIAALKDGVLRDIPGTGHRPNDPFASIKAVSPKAAAEAQQEDSEDA